MLIIASCETDQDVPVSAVILDSDLITLSVGESIKLVAIVTPFDATNKNVFWSSSDESVVTVDQKGIVNAISVGQAIIKASAGEIVVTCNVIVKELVIAVSSITLDQNEIIIVEGGSVTLRATVKPLDATDNTVSWTSSNDAVASVNQNGLVLAVQSGTTTITATSGEKSADCKVIVKSIPKGAVDLGLSVFWAECNLGASSPEEYGDYYAWGETETKSEYSWDTYKWCNGSEESLTKYNNDSEFGVIDNMIELESEDDVAHVKLGEKWRLPTDGELAELRENCAFEWTTLNGIYGGKFTSLISGHTDKWIFVPAAGYLDGTTLWGNSDVGWCSGCCWSSTNACIADDPYFSWTLYFYDNMCIPAIGYRHQGLTIRPVSE